ncbi:MAG: hypothetical protein LBR52_04680 [Prevotellaceae bacterium]|jgi:hypothetical protein|nr:hypothetical protein [Prevotellaceae bacterium]
MILPVIEFNETLTLAQVQSKIDNGDYNDTLQNYSFLIHCAEGIARVNKETRTAEIISGGSGNPGTNEYLSPGSGFETTHQNSANTMNTQPSFGNDAAKILIRAIPSVNSKIVSLSFMNAQASAKDVRLGIFDSQRQLLKQTGTISLNTLGYITLDLESPQEVAADEIYYLGISMSNKNNSACIIGNNINVLSGTGNIPGQAFRATEASTSNWNGIELNKMEGQLFVPWIKANAG